MFRIMAQAWKSHYQLGKPVSLVVPDLLTL
jgi:hypothetical protein